MPNKLFTIYRSSAGSGKTRTLAKAYLSLALRFRADYYKHILAVTFTNKATQEMKTRILQYLNAYALGKNDALAMELMQELNLDPLVFKERTTELRADILHNYAQFSISTIDAFFQKVIRAFTREAGLSGDYRLEIDQDQVTEEVINKLIDELGSNEQLTKWLIEFAKDNLENDRPWDVRSNLLDFAREIFKEEFRAIEDELLRTTAEPDFFKNLQTSLRKKTHSFTATVNKLSHQAIAIIQQNGWDRPDFKYAGGGVYAWLLKVEKFNSVNEFDEEAIGARPRKDYLEAKNWPAKDSVHAKTIFDIAESNLIPILSSLLDFRDQHYQEALSAEVVLANFYAFGLLADLSRKLREYKEENNMMLLADASKFLQGIIQDSDTPFIYEKVGSFYKNYLIDEFQDTSRMQWSNFKPLLINSLDQGYPAMVVGDVKQSIYRWRGGDLQLLQQDVEQHIGSERVEVKELSSNYRSAPIVVNFNNAFFKAITEYAQTETGEALLSDTYRDVAQLSSKKDAGCVKVQFIRKPEEDTTWKQEALMALVKQIEDLQDLGVSLRDMALLVRNNREGVEVAEFLLNYKNTSGKNTYRYDVISSESLRLEAVPTVSVLVSALQFLINSEDSIARAQLSYDFARLQHEHIDLHNVFSIGDRSVFLKKLPVAFTKEMARLKKMPLFEITEMLIKIFDLGKCKGELVYLHTFQNLVLEFYTQERNDIRSFLDWWEDNKEKKSIQVSGDVDAMQIYTIHKSKGLQFKYVFMPFCSWDIDHKAMMAPTLWTHYEIDDKSIVVPVKYASKLEDTFFADAYREERTRSYLDNLNLLYVAFTRAEKALIIFAPEPKGAKEKTVAALLFKALSADDTLSKYWNEASLSWMEGKLEKAEASIAPMDDHILSLENYEVSSWRQRLSLRLSADSPFKTDKLIEEASRKKGVLMHTLFAQIKYKSEAERVFNQALQRGIINQEEQTSISNQFYQLLSNPQIATWFEEDWEVKTEAPILIPNGRDVRIDRIMIRNDQAIVIDYKTGEPREEDQEQVHTYMRILFSMNFMKVEGFVLYLNTGEVIPVKAESSKNGKNQLGLGI